MSVPINPINAPGTPDDNEALIAGDTVALTEEERGAIRSYLQRSEVRLSTLHRVASALLSGAGLMVLLPVVEHDAVVSVIRSLLTGAVDEVRLLLLIAVVASLAVPFTALWLVLRDLTQFYFHANHIGLDRGESFAPRYTLTALQLPSGELGAVAQDALVRRRRSPEAISLLVPANEVARARVDERITAYGGLGSVPDGTDETRARALLALAGSRQRDLLDEVAKVEHGMARHILRTQTIVLRYVKALLALLTTALATFAASAVVDSKSPLTGGDLVWLAAILLAWAPTVVIAVTTPVRWLERLLRNEGATHTAVHQDPELTMVEDATVRLAICGFIVAGVAMVWALTRSDVLSAGRVAGAVVLVGSSLALGITLRRWAEGHIVSRLVRRIPPVNAT